MTMKCLLELLACGPASMSAMRRPEVFDATIACSATIFSSFSNSACLMSSRSMIASMIEIALGDLLEIVVERADLDERRVTDVHERRGLGFLQLLEIGRDDVEEQDRDTSIGAVSGDTAAHHASA